jgi:hypothetical protein
MNFGGQIEGERRRVIWWNVKNQSKYDQKYAILQIFVKI